MNRIRNIVLSFSGEEFQTRTQTNMTPPYLWMGPRGALWLELTLDGRREPFLSIRERLCREFGGVITERRLEGSGDKEYTWIDVEGSSLLLMRKVGLGTALGGEAPGDLDVLLRLARAFDAPLAGWRWSGWRLRSWLTRSGPRRAARRG